MKCFHAHVSVADLQKSVRFYAALFGASPSVLKPDYAKWELEDPRVIFAVSQKSDRKPGLNHLGIRVTEATELASLYEALGAANISTHDESCARCCYAESDKHWAIDPEGIVWETYHTMSSIAVYGEDRGEGIDPLVRTPEPATKAADSCASTGSTEDSSR